MAPPDDNRLRRLLATFTVEAREHIDAIAAGLIELERATVEEAQTAILDTAFRAAHSLKGAARTVNVRDIESLCQALESLFAALRRKEIAVCAELFDLLHRVVAMLGALLQSTGAGSAKELRPSIAELMRSLQSATSKHINPVATTPSGQAAQAITFEPVIDMPVMTPSARYDASDTVRVDTAKLDAVLLQVEELLSAKLATTLQAQRLRQFRAEPVEWKKRWNMLRPDIRAIRQTIERDRTPNSQWARVVEFLDWSRDCMESLETGLVEVTKVADHDQRLVGAMVDNLLDEMKKVVMQPFSVVLNVLPRTVRELSREQGKFVELVVRGDDIEIDRRILEQLKDPLIHLMRNCIDHGVETPEVRDKAGKSRQGTLSVTIAAHDGSNVELLIADDGRGIDVTSVRAAAVRHQALSAPQAEALSDADALSFIFHSGVSTSPIITDISGRGLGLAIVKEKVEKLSGTLSVDTTVGKGTTFRIILPLTLARFRGVLVRVAGSLFVMPTSNVERVLRVIKSDIRTVENRETIVHSGQVFALARLGEVLQLPAAPDDEEQPAHQPAIILAHGLQRIAFLIDEVINEQEVLVKRLGKQLVRVRNIAGATVLGNGKVVPILNVPDLLESAVTSAGNARITAAPARLVKKQSVLVAEDSITSRTLLKSILETAGFRVETAVDGMEALTRLRSGEFDLVVSDVEMPRMDGIGLTMQLRADKKLSQIPVILVTALNTREDRERGVDAGANAYIVKSSFDQSSLLEVVRRLI